MKAKEPHLLTQIMANTRCSFDPFNYAFVNGVAKDEVISSNSEIWRNQMTTNSASLNGMFHEVEASNSNSIDCFTTNSFTYSSGNKLHHMDKGEIECNKEMGWNTTQAHEQNLHMGGQIPYDEAFVPTESGDDLFDVLGADFKTKLFNNCWDSSYLSNESAQNVQSWDGKLTLVPTEVQVEA